MHCYIELYPIDRFATWHIYMTTSNFYMMRFATYQRIYVHANLGTTHLDQVEEIF